MPKMILEFDLNEDKEAAELALNGSRYKYVLADLNEWMRNRIKYGEEDLGSVYTIALEGVRKKLFELLEESNLSLDG